MAEIDYDELIAALLARAFHSIYTGEVIDENIGAVINNKEAWNGKYNLPDGGIPAEDLSQSVQELLARAAQAIIQMPDLSGYATAQALTAHTENTSIHVSTTDKANWNDKYTKPPDGIPSGDLAATVQAAIALATTAVQQSSLASLTQPKINTTSALPASGTPLTANTKYIVTDFVRDYTFVTPAQSGWAHGWFTTAASGTLNIQFGTGAEFFGGLTPTFENDKRYEFDVDNNVWAFEEVGAV